jgi:hypothetical protein
MFVRKIVLVAFIFLTTISVPHSHALDLTLLECGTIESTQQESYDVRVPCKAILQRGESSFGENRSGDVQSRMVGIGIHTSGTAQSMGLNFHLVGWTNVCAALIHDVPGRALYIQGAIPLCGEAAVHFVLNVKGRCGTSVTMSGRAHGAYGNAASSSEISVALPACPNVCPDHSTACGSIADHADELVTLEEILRAQRIVVYELVDPIITSTSDSSIKTKAREFRDLADTIKRELVRDMHRNYPKTTQLCPNCPVRNLVGVKQDFVARSRKMQRLTRQALLFARSCHPNPALRNTLQTAQNLFDQFRAAVVRLPNRTSVCEK